MLVFFTDQAVYLPQVAPEISLVNHVVINKNTTPHDVEECIGVMSGITHFGVGNLESI